MHLQSIICRDELCAILQVQFLEAYRLNILKESLKNRSEDGVTNIVQTLCGLKKLG